MASFSDRFIVLAYYGNGSITLAGYDHDSGQPETIFGGIQVNSSPYYFNSQTFQTGNGDVLTVFLDEEGQIENAVVRKEVSIRVKQKEKSEAEISIMAVNDYSVAYQNYTVNGNGEVKSQTSFKVGWFFFGLFLGVGTLVLVYYGYKWHQRRRLNEQTAYRNIQN